ncbi:hypothetical protein [Aminipila terrae]|uniref:Uncharacterized protein n=1 Tax=Aminipila terrae TaxID=2697030 RepID=A0A6P1MFE3_9FIRM|nr:hypothetical protein [Aminipila terrae]QHI71304.1 hypothetical protein Ami3637_01835 [Aminipila terrae]
MENQRKRMRIVGFTFTLLITLFIITLGLFWLVGFNSYAKIQYEEKNLKEIQKITDESIGQIENIDTKEILNGAAADKEKITLTQSEQKILDTEIAKIDDVKKQELLAALAKNYSSVMENQKKQAFHMLDDLIKQGRKEWKGIEERGENTPIVKGEKISEYLAMVNVMEKNMDQSFETVLAKMQEQLEAEGIDPDPTINQYRKEYKSIKEENRQIMMDKGIKAIKSK